MIHDAEVEVTCDGKGCRESERVILGYVYSGLSEKSGRYDDDDSKVEAKLIKRDWIVKDGKHFCGEMCANRK